ncbi:hypothetical protein B0H14DRAFT_2637362 [Mycena olivaceomarginata]|nr:hypothetical protein B0H14DRAFT_2637362 [Mycena olivaceomarginata]
MAPDDDDDKPPVLPLPRLPNPKRLLPSDKSMNRWMRLLRDIFLRQLLRHDGCADSNPDLCPHCGDVSKQVHYRCEDCAGSLLLYFTERSGATYLIWTPSPVKHVPILNPGMPTLSYCITTASTPSTSIIAAATLLAVRTHISKLLRAGWYPATDERPQTATTFRVLDTFHLHTLQAKTTAYDFYTVLERLMNSTGIKPPNQYQPFLRMARQYCHLLMLKRAGRGHNLSGVWGTGVGELAVECPVCPNPQINLPEGWENAPPEDHEIKDPGLGTGWAYVTENPPYQHYLLGVMDQKEMSTCSGLAALDYANTKFSRGYSTTGIGMGVCARHEFVQPTGVGDLQKGRRFANMDYIFGLILRHKDPRLRKIISYDIVCQWWKFLLERMAQLPPLVHVTMILRMFQFVIPKMHIHAHTLDCQVKFSLNLVPGSGQTDGEGIERPWAAIGAIASSTRVSGPGARHDILDDHWSFWNWLKTISLPAILHRRLDTARKEAASQRSAFEVFSLQQAERVPAWKKMVEDFEVDGTKKNPYELKRWRFICNSQRKRRRRQRKGMPLLHKVTPSAFIAAGLELEEQQRVLAKQLEPAEELAESVPLMLPSSLEVAEREGRGCAPGVLEIEDSLRSPVSYSTPSAAQPTSHQVAFLALQEAQHLTSRNEHTVTHDCSLEREQNSVALGEIPNGVDRTPSYHKWGRIKGGVAKVAERGYLLHAGPRGAVAECRETEKATEQRLNREEEMREDGLLPQLGDDDDEMVMRGGENVREVSWIWTVAGTVGTDEGLEDGKPIVVYDHSLIQQLDPTITLYHAVAQPLPSTTCLYSSWISSIVCTSASAHREQVWVRRAVDVPVSTIPAAEAEGMIAYAMKQAQVYRDMAERAEATRTEVKLSKGKKHTVARGGSMGRGTVQGDAVLVGPKLEGWGRAEWGRAGGTAPQRGLGHEQLTAQTSTWGDAGRCTLRCDAGGTKAGGVARVEWGGVGRVQRGGRATAPQCGRAQARGEMLAGARCAAMPAGPKLEG